MRTATRARTRNRACTLPGVHTGHRQRTPPSGAGKSCHVKRATTHADGTIAATMAAVARLEATVGGTVPMGAI